MMVHFNRTCVVYAIFILFGTSLCDNGDSQVYIFADPKNMIINMATGYEHADAPPDHFPFMQQMDNDIAQNGEGILYSEQFSRNDQNISKMCFQHMELFLQDLVSRKAWALSMVDAFGKPSSGHRGFQSTWLGNWEGCINVESNIKPNTIPTVEFSGKYCLASLIYQADVTNLKPHSHKSTAAIIGLCFPDSCSSEDANILLPFVISLLPWNMTHGLVESLVRCQENHTELTATVIAVIVVCSTFVALVIAASVFEIYLKRVKLQETTDDDTTQTSSVTLESVEAVFVIDHTIGGTTENDLNTEHIGKIRYSQWIKGAGLDNASQEEKCRKQERSCKQGERHKQEGIDQRVGSDQDMHSKESSHKNETHRHGVLAKVVLSFSALANAMKITDTSKAAGMLSCLNGIRFISMSWIIMGHLFTFVPGVLENSGQFSRKTLRRFISIIIAKSTLAVDTFFLLSGMLVAYLAVKQMKNCGGPRKFNWLLYYFHRFWRLTPPYMFFFMVYVELFKYWGDGPIWLQYGIEARSGNCETAWWKNLLYINNLFDGRDMCMDWSWYLANDMQFYVISPLMLIPLYYNAAIGTLLCLVLLLSSIVTTAVISHTNEFSAAVYSEDFFNKIYVKPWCRIGPYIVGILTGYLLYRHENGPNIKLRKVVSVIGWVCSTVVALLIVYGLHSPDGTEQLGNTMSAIYNATSRTAWAMCVAWVVFACAVGSGGPANMLLSLKCMIPFSRLTYCTYLVHPVIIISYLWSQRTLAREYDFYMVYTYLGTVCVCYPVALIVSLLFESPMMGLEKTILGRRK